MNGVLMLNIIQSPIMDGCLMLQFSPLLLVNQTFRRWIESSITNTLNRGINGVWFFLSAAVLHGGQDIILWLKWIPIIIKLFNRAVIFQKWGTNTGKQVHSWWSHGTQSWLRLGRLILDACLEFLLGYCSLLLQKFFL